ncbi:MAG: TIGR03885 family FMN-dependent LLM class oxidoreductase [Chitinophagaceae bacterium]|nr:MAG: TIGR03885 family FMN-dependent LLM class oxidoreductase [Chitinophagaceae bacterium]
MALLAYHASHEQFSPSHLLQLAIQAEQAGFDAIHSSDHFNPWSHRQGHSGFSFAWVASALQATRLPVSMICTPGQRYHPAIVAQAIATLGEMYPGRYTVELGSGEALNECITGDGWPDKKERNQRLLDSAQAIRSLLNGQTLTRRGPVTMQHARLWSLPDTPVPLFCAAISAETAGWSGRWADGLITTSGTVTELQEKMEAWAANGGSGKPVYVQYSFSFAPTRQEAIDAAYDQWRSNLVERDQLADLRTTEDFDNLTADLDRDTVASKIPLITGMDELFEKVDEIRATGVELISLHNVNRNHEEFIREFGRVKKTLSPS